VACAQASGTVGSAAWRASFNPRIDDALDNPASNHVRSVGPNDEPADHAQGSPASFWEEQAH
jgi:hypothetical protein